MFLKNGNAVIQIAILLLENKIETDIDNRFQIVWFSKITRDII